MIKLYKGYFLRVQYKFIVFVRIQNHILKVSVIAKSIYNAENIVSAELKNYEYQIMNVVKK